MTIQPAPIALSEHAVRRWMTSRIAVLLQVPAAAVHADAVLGELGLSSIQAVELAADLESWSGLPIPATLVYECPTVRDAARQVAALAPRPLPL
ncbi:acyl carrier protein [Pseudonocardia alaniniphila]|uniref:Acyl carrier protein n=1 Tax=Pseudonocardia alaniniphila TaxID=75291 RepID=A0ABS9T999_9PSEU|nr:acyl carrier protein [Pseudonocardia alaniniphila]MCH6165099.1 acyl carrier protein [Pseudonocardia alaniniphila]